MSGNLSCPNTCKGERMELENTKAVIELRRSGDVNKHLKLGWVLLNQYVTDYNGAQYPPTHQTMHFVLAWQGDGEPEYPYEQQHEDRTIRLGAADSNSN